MTMLSLTLFQPELPPVLHGLNFEIKPGEKVVILGRTGSGKSTLALSFFRFVEPSEGRIVIDGVDITKIGLTDLRSKLTIIPRTSAHDYHSTTIPYNNFRGPHYPEWYIALYPRCLQRIRGH